MRKIIISESEKQNILELYGIKTLLKEIEIKLGE